MMSVVGSPVPHCKGTNNDCQSILHHMADGVYLLHGQDRTEVTTDGHTNSHASFQHIAVTDFSGSLLRQASVTCALVKKNTHWAFFSLSAWFGICCFTSWYVFISFHMEERWLHGNFIKSELNSSNYRWESNYDGQCWMCHNLILLIKYIDIHFHFCKQGLTFNFGSGWNKQAFISDLLFFFVVSQTLVSSVAVRKC